MLRLFLVVALCMTSSVSHAAECKDIQARYKAKLDAAKYESKSFRKITLGYLKSLEQAFASCFKSGAGAALVKARAKLEKDKPPAKRKPQDKTTTARPEPPRRRADFSSNDSADSSTFASYRRTNIGGGSAALLSLMIPGLGQGVNNNALGWLFFLGSAAAYGAAGGVAASAITARGVDQGMMTGAAVLAGLGGIIHLSSVIHAAVTAKR